MIKFILAILGYAILKFPGAILGYIIGSAMENFSIKTNTDETFREGYRKQVDFSRSFLELTAAVLRADGAVTRSELEFVKELYKQNFGLEKTKADMLLLRDILQGEINWETACANINQNMVKTERVKLIHYLFGIAKADGNITLNELNIIQHIAQRINLSQWDFESIRMRFTAANKNDFWEEYTSGYSRQQTSYYKRTDHYKVLTLEPNATDEEIKTTYRKLARQYHPDKHASKSPEEVKSNEEKFKKIQEAYNQIKKERGL